MFDHTDGAQYRLAYTKDGVAEALWTEFSARTAQVTTPASGTVADPVLLIRSGTRWIRYTGDWALYDGYVTESGRTTVELRVRTAPERIAPASPKFFDRIYFYGAEEGMSLTLHKECSLRPRFSSAPGYGSAITFADVARHPIRQSALLEALQHLFNLRFHTEEETKTVRIEPADEFFGSGTTADWRDRSDFSQPVVLADIAPEIHESRTWGYQEGDGAVNRFNAGAGSPFGEWSVRTDSYAAREGDQVLRNPLFRPTLSEAGHYANAPSAQIMQVGDRDDVQEDGTNFTPRIVRFAGLHPLPAGERWGYPSGLAEYPLAAFHFTGTQRRRASRSVSKTATASAACTIATTARQHRKPPASASPSRCGSRRTNSKASSRPAPGCPTCVRYSGSTPGRGNPRHAPCYRKLRPAGGIGQMHLHTPERR